MPSIDYDDLELHFQFGIYETTGAISASLITSEGEPYARLSVNLDADEMARLPEGAFFLKDWSENQQIAEFLLDQHILKIATPRVTALTGRVWTDAVTYQSDPSKRGDWLRCYETYGESESTEGGCRFHE